MDATSYLANALGSGFGSGSGSMNPQSVANLLKSWGQSNGYHHHHHHHHSHHHLQGGHCQSGSSSRAGSGGTSASSGGQGGSTWSATNNGDGTASINTGNYTIQLNKADSGITVTDNKTGAVTSVAGDPHVTENGQTFTFKDNTTFKLPDGTSLTIKTTPFGNGQTLSNEVDITKGNQAIQVTGLAQTSAAPLSISQGNFGRALAASNSGDATIYEQGGQWRTKDGGLVDQQYADAKL